MPGKVEWLCLANPDRIPFHFVDERVAGVNPQFVANLLRQGGLALTGNLAAHRHYHHAVPARLFTAK
jgi:hypothetical protein